MKDLRPILLVEDNSIDVMAIKRAFMELKVTNPLVHKANGSQALEYLRSKGNKKPCVILLDLNMPKMNGIEFLKIVKDDDELKSIPVVVLTISEEERDIAESFRLSVGGYIVKPVDYKKFVEAVRLLNLYWTLSELPPNGG